MPQVVIEGVVSFMRFKKGAGALVVGYWSLVIGHFETPMINDQRPITNDQFLTCFRGVLLFVWLTLTASFASAADAPSVTLFDADGRTTIGMLNGITAGSLSVETTAKPAETRSWKWADIVSLRFDDRPVPREPRGAAIWLANGDRLVAKGTSVEDERLNAAWVRFEEWPAFSLPLESVRGLSLMLPQHRDPRDELATWILDRREKRDEVRLLNGDLIGGELLDWRDGFVNLSTTASKLKLPINDVRDIGFNAELLALPESQGFCWLVSLSDGSRLTLKSADSRIEHGVVSATHVSGTLFEIPIEAICDLRVLHGRAVFLSDVPTVESTHTPFLPNSRNWPMQRDRAVDGRALRVDGREFSKGLGMQSRSTATFDLAGKYRSFAATIGFDDTTTGPGTVACAVEVDGKRLCDVASLSRTNGSTHLPIIKLTGAKRLTLIVDFGSLGDVQDRVNWCDAVLLK